MPRQHPYRMTNPENLRKIIFAILGPHDIVMPAPGPHVAHPGRKQTGMPRTLPHPVIVVPGSTITYLEDDYPLHIATSVMKRYATRSMSSSVHVEEGTHSESGGSQVCRSPHLITT